MSDLPAPDQHWENEKQYFSACVELGLSLAFLAFVLVFIGGTDDWVALVVFAVTAILMIGNVVLWIVTRWTRKWLERKERWK